MGLLCFLIRIRVCVCVCLHDVPQLKNTIVSEGLKVYYIQVKVLAQLQETATKKYSP